MDGIISGIKMGAAILGAVVGFLIGERDGLLTALLVFMAVDYASGAMAAIKNKTIDSKVGFIGIARKIFILMLVLIGNVMDMYVLAGTAVVRGTIIAFYLANEGLSILENAGKLGLKYPPKLQEVLSQLREEDADER